jgi:diguanylate cyclase (GGDEF)-like protein
MSMATALISGLATRLIGWSGLVIGLVAAPVIGVIWLFLARALGQWRRARIAAPLGGPGTIAADRIDELTGLANMNGLNAWFQEKSRRLVEDKKSIVILAADLANYNQLLQSRGLEQTNTILREAAKRVSSFTGEDGIAARTDGDEFAAIATVVPNHALEVAVEQAGKMAEMLQRPIEMPTGIIWIGGSVGAATGSPLEGAAILERARQALKRAKKIGKGHYVVDGLDDKK